MPIFFFFDLATTIHTPILSQDEIKNEMEPNFHYTKMENMTNL